MHVSDRRFVEEITESFFAGLERLARLGKLIRHLLFLLLQFRDLPRGEFLGEPTEFFVRRAQLFVSLFPFKFRAAARGENLQGRNILLGRLHGLRVQDGDMANGAALRVFHRHTDIALGMNLPQPKVFGKLVRQTRGGRTHVTRRDALAGRAGKTVAETRAEIRPFPIRQRARLQLAQRLADEGVSRPERLRCAPRQRAEELIANRRGRPFRDRAEDAGGLGFYFFAARGHGM